MNNIKGRVMEKFVYVGIALCFFTSCMDDVSAPLVGDETTGVSFVIEDFIPGVDTKSAFEIETMKFQWSSADAIGIFPSSGYQMKFSMEEGSGTNAAYFDGGDWGLKSYGTYYGYYPFSKINFESEEMRERVWYSYEGQEACFADENGVVDLSKYDFMASGASVVENGNVKFNFKHLGALCKISFNAPASGTYTHLIIEVENEVIPVSGYYDATDKDGDGIIALGIDEYKKSQFEVLFPSDHQAFEASDKVELYFLLPPVDLTAHAMTLKLLDSEYNYYVADMEPKNIEAGKSYSWDVETGVPPVIPLGAAANCYIVSKSGTYSFSAVQGNGATTVGDVASVDVLWESFGTDVTPKRGDLIPKVSYNENVITFTTAAFKEGNAVIAARDESGNILWSWHIWLTDKPTDQVYKNDAGTMMDRNLGATSATPGDVGALGLLYQWGRKDPFLGSSSISSSTQAKSTSTWPSPVPSDASNGTIAYVTAHPRHFITLNSNNYDWYYTGDSTTDDTRWQSTKTIYDPCPAGYRVPEGGSDGIWSKAFGTSNSFNEQAFDSTNRGFDFGKSEITKYLTEETTCWYPAAGYLINYLGSLVDTGDMGIYWSCTPIYNYAYHLTIDFFFNGFVYPSVSYNGFRADGRSVRCLREQ